MSEQIVDLVEGVYPASSDVLAVAAGAGGTAGRETGRIAALDVLSGVNAGLRTETDARMASDRELAARLDQLTATPPSDASAEIKDARVDVQGVAHASMGDAIRVQARRNAESTGQMTWTSLQGDWASVWLLESITVHPGHTVPATLRGVTVANFRDHVAVSANNATISDPIRVRMSNGQLRHANLTLDGDKDVDGVSYLAFDRDGNALRTHRYGEFTANHGFQPDEYWAAMLEYPSDPDFKAKRWRFEPRRVPWLNPGGMSVPTVIDPTLFKLTRRHVFEGMNVNKGMVLDGRAHTLPDWKLHLTAGMGSMADPLRIRYEGGQPIYPSLHIEGLSADKEGVIYYAYDRSGRYLRAVAPRTWQAAGGTWGDDEYWAALVQYPNVPERVWTLGEVSVDWLNASATATEYTVGTNGDWPTLTACFTALQNDASEKTILIQPGEYDIFAELGGKAKWAGYAGTDNWRDVQPVVPANTTVRGVGRVVLRMTPKDDEISARAATLLSPLNVSGSCTIETLDIIAANCRYAIHDEASSKSEYAGSVHTYRDVRAVKQTGGRGYSQTLGFGEARNGVYRFDHCRIEGSSPFTIHTNVNRAGDGTLIDITDSLFLDLTGNPAWIGLSTSGDNKAVQHVTIANSTLSGIRLYGENHSSIANSYQVTLIGCPPADVTSANGNPYPVRQYNTIRP